MSRFIEQVAPDKWKVFKVLPVLTHDNNISQDDFARFLERHQSFSDVIFSENNDEMTDSYLMIDPIGRFFQNSNVGEGYLYSKPIPQIGIRAAINEINFDVSRFHGRYKNKRIDMREIS